MECAQGQSPEVPCREFKGSGGFAQKGLSAKDIRRDGKTTVTTVALFQGPGRPVAGSLTGNTKHGTNLKRKSQYCSIEPDLSQQFRPGRALIAAVLGLSGPPSPTPYYILTSYATRTSHYCTITSTLQIEVQGQWC